MSRREGNPLLDRARFPPDPWRLVETEYCAENLGTTETLFSVANGYLGMRGNPEEGRQAVAHGTFINGFHETWPIRHAEAAFGFAKTGQTIVNVPDTKLIKLYVDDEPLILGTSVLDEYERSLDFRDGVLRRRLLWRMPSGKRVLVESTRMVSVTQRHLAVMTFEVTMLSGDAPVVVSSQILNRQDGQDEYHEPQAARGGSTDPRKAGDFHERVLQPRAQRSEDGRLLLGFECTRSGMTLAVAADHSVDTEDEFDCVLHDEEDLAKAVFRIEAREGHTFRLEKLVSYHTSRGVPVRELADRCDRTLHRAARHHLDHYLTEQQHWFDRFWETSDVVVSGAGEDLQQAIRHNLFTVAQATGRTDGQGIAAKGVTGSGYEGHYFWDSEIYVLPFLTYTQPPLARNALHFRRSMLPAARVRAQEMAQRGAIFPWRTINGEEASAYYPAGSAQMHINGDIVYALMQFVTATDDHDFLVRDGVDLLVETARMWVDLGFWRSNGRGPEFHIHGVTGPDEYTTVVNNNLFTNLMARFNLESAHMLVEHLLEHDPQAHERLVSRLHVTTSEVEEWRRCAEGMVIPFDETLGIHPQDDLFLEREVWDLSETPEELRPLMLHFHPLVIYRFQVLKQADVVLAMFLHGDRFTDEQKRANFEYYDPITTGDSTLSAVVQSIMAAEVGHHVAAMNYFLEALYVDLDDLHANTVDGMHIASAGGVWSMLVFGFGGMRDFGGRLSFDPRLPADWAELRFTVTWRGSRLRVRLTQTELELCVESGSSPVEVDVRETHYLVDNMPLRIDLDGQGPRLEGLLGSVPQTGGTRADGTRLTARAPAPVTDRVPTSGTEARARTHRAGSDVPTAGRTPQTTPGPRANSSVPSLPVRSARHRGGRVVEPITDPDADLP